MAAPKMKVEYLDGREETVLITPRAFAAAEEKFGGLGSSVRMQAAYFTTWMSLHKAGKEPDPYDKWLDKVASCGDVTRECDVCGAKGPCGEDEEGELWIHGTPGDREDDGSADPTPPSPSTDDS